MSEEILKNFYESVLTLLQHQSPDHFPKNSVAGLLRTFKHTNYSNILQQFGLQDIQNIILVLQGHTPENIVVYPSKSTILDFFQISLPNIQKNLKEIHNYSSLPMVQERVAIIEKQLQLWNNLLNGLKEKNIIQVITSLIEAYPTLNGDGKKIILDSFQKIGFPVVLVLVQILYKDDHKKYNELFSILRAMDNIALPALAVALNYPDEKVRCSTTEVLKKWKSKESISALSKSLYDPSWKVRKLSAEALGEIGTAEAIKALLTGIKDKHASVRLEIARALGKLHMMETLEALSALLQDPSWEIRKEALEAIANLGPQATECLGQALNNDNIVVRKMASRFLINMSTPQTVPALRKALQNADINIREQSVTALGKILQGEEVLIMLKSAMDDTAPLVRFAALQVLIEIKNKMESKSILILLNKALKDTEQIIRQRANSTIREILSNTAK